MSLSSPFIRRPVGTTLLTIAVGLAGAIAANVLPIAPLPQVDFPTISVSAGLPGASAQIMAASVATPLETTVHAHRRHHRDDLVEFARRLHSVTLQFDLSRNIDGAARDVQAAINAARTYLPTNLPSNPSYRKINPADSPIMLLGLTSDKYDVTKIYDLASTILVQKLSQIQGVGQVFAGGGAAPAVRVEVNPNKLESFGLTLGNVQSVLSLQNSHSPRGQLSDNGVSEDIITNDQISQAADYRPLIMGYHNGAAVRLQDVADVVDSTQNLRTAGYLDGHRAIFIIIFRQPGANIIETVDRVKAQLPIPSSRASHRNQLRPSSSIAPPPFARRYSRWKRLCSAPSFWWCWWFSSSCAALRSTLIPAVAVPISLIGTCAVMYLLGFSLDNLSLMALTIATGFVVDDAIVVMENITRHLEAGMEPVCRRAQGRPGDRLYRLFHQHVADRRIYSHPHDGRHRRPALPRVCHHAFGGHPHFDGHLAHHYALTMCAHLLRAPRETRNTTSSRASASRHSTGWH